MKTKTVFLLFLLFCSFVPLKAQLDSQARQKISVTVITRHLQGVEHQMESESRVAFFIKESKEVEDLLFENFKNVKWLRRSGDFEPNDLGGYTLATDGNVMGILVTVGEFKERDDGTVECKVFQHSGRLGGVGYRALVRKVEDRWIVVEYQIDDSGVS